MSRPKALFNKKIVLIAAFFSVVGSAAYACMMVGPRSSYSFCLQVSYIGMPGMLRAAVLSIALHGGAHGGGPLGELLLIATPANFFLYLGIGLAAVRLRELLNIKK